MQDSAYNFFNDRRKFERKPLKIDVHLKIGVHLKGIGLIKNVSKSGVCISSPELFAFFKPEQAHVFQSAEITIFLPSESFSVHGTVVRVDTFKDELAVTVHSTSNGQKWETFTEKKNLFNK
ncbi:MAG: PilZ domain-containing protein [Desulfomonilia bacterium]